MPFQEILKRSIHGPQAHQKSGDEGQDDSRYDSDGFHSEYCAMEGVYFLWK